MLSHPAAVSDIILLKQSPNHYLLGPAGKFVDYQVEDILMLRLNIAGNFMLLK